jgi:hypothetical protein
VNGLSGIRNRGRVILGASVAVLLVVVAVIADQAGILPVELSPLSAISGTRTYAPAVPLTISNTYPEPAPTVQGSGVQTVYVLGSDNKIWWRNVTGASSWAQLDGSTFSSAPAAAARTKTGGRLDLFARGNDHAIYHRSLIDGTWSAWENLGGGTFSSAPTATRFGFSGSAGYVEDVYIFARGDNGELYWRVMSGGGWASMGVGNQIVGAPAATTHAFGPVVVARGTDNAIWMQEYSSVYKDSAGKDRCCAWSGWKSLGGVLTSAPAIGWTENSFQLHVFARGGDNALWSRSRNYHQTTWGDWMSHGGLITSAPGAAETIDGVTAFARGGDNALYYLSEQCNGQFPNAVCTWKTYTRIAVP